MSPSKRQYHVVPPGELRCVWMTAGILSYQLCDRTLDCDECPLDRALRRHGRAGAGTSESPAPRPDAGPDLPADRSYSRNHCWIQQVSDRHLRIGLEPGLSSAILTAKTIVFPFRGQSVRRGEACLWIVMEGGTLPLSAPVGGIVLNTNDRLSEDPHLLHADSLDGGWLYDVEVSEPEEGSLMNSRDAAPKYGADDARLSSSLAEALQHRPSVGVTLADGGRQLQSVADMLGAKKYFSLLQKAFGSL